MKSWPLCLLLALSSMRASAFVKDPFVTPAQPTPSDAISVHVITGWCHAPTDGVDQAELKEVTPGQLQLIADGVVLPEGHPFCIHPPFTYRFNVGMLPAGSYSLQFFMRDDIGGSGLVGFGNVQFHVASPAMIPTTSIQSSALLALAFLGAAFRRARRTHLPCIASTRRWLMAALLLPVVPTAQAFVDAPYISPAHPMPGDRISLLVRMGGCHASFDGVDQAKLTVEGPGQLRLVTDGAALPPGHPFCIYDPPFTYRFELGTLPAGNYALRFSIFDDFSALEPIDFGSVRFTVAAPARIPAGSSLTLAAIALLLVAGSWPKLSRALRD